MFSFFKNMKIGVKIGLGFFLVLAMVGVVAFSGLTGLIGVQDGFEHYRELARDSNLAGRLQANSLMAQTAVGSYLAAKSQESLDEAAERFKLLDGLLETAREEIKSPERAALVEESANEAARYSGEFQKIVALGKVRGRIVKPAIQDGWFMANELEKLTDWTVGNGYYDYALELRGFLADLYKSRLMMTAYDFGSQNPADAEKAVASFAALRESMASFRDGLTDPELGQSVQAVLERLDAYMEALAGIIKNNAEAGALAADLASLGHSMSGNLERIKLSVIADQDELGPRLQAGNRATIGSVQTFSIAAVVLGVLLAVLITLAIIAPLKRAIAAAKGVAEGDFSRDLAARRKDELGDITRAVGSIQETILEMKKVFEAEVEAVQLGDLNSRGDAVGFRGGFAEIIQGGNAMADAFTTFIESVPVPMITIDREMKLNYANKAALGVLEKNPEVVKGRNCFDFMRTDDCNSERCACARAMKSRGKEESETTARPGGSELEIRYIGVPLEKDGQVVGAFELIIDETAIKQAQKRMMIAAGNADAISHRLSSSSEELAAQVEQVGRGSEVQRDRVQETATAMEQMNATVVEVAKNASNAASMSDRASQEAESGAEIVNQAVEAIDQVHAATRQMQADMGKLGEKAEAIGQVMDVIADIADQTNLLALNAAIEAARAGDAGRGFAVVADEVRKLAEKTMSATHEVGESIRAIQDAARDNIGSMNEATGYVEKATELASRSGDALTRIVGLVRESAVQVEGIASASEEQSAASEQISGALEEINRVVAETTEGMVQSATAVQELAQMSSELVEIINELQSGDGGSKAGSRSPNRPNLRIVTG